ncbi:hypothetical protein [Brevibacillus laterosporus]|uniref:Fibronectin type-III domain-containing protein n=1 Tax=Brevibacillus laterosporus TaxID=1465 RepID=A0AAP8U663_BRELA|nr:hypothetical protein [Brevibacillus laterosporus]PPB08814.1 hypothetical protein C4A77_05865 [Brevibacillus laterosporus]
MKINKNIICLLRASIFSLVASQLVLAPAYVSAASSPNVIVGNSDSQSTPQTNEENFHLKIEPGKVPNSKILSWKNTKGVTKVELKQGEIVKYSSSTRLTSMTITNIPNGTFDVYLNGKLAGTISLQDNIPLTPDKGRSVELSITDGRVKNSKLIQWKGTNGRSIVILKQGDVEKYRLQTSGTSIRIYNIPCGTYDVYINSEKMGSFTQENSSSSFTNKNQVASNVKISKDGKKSVVVEWKGTNGEVVVELKEKGSKETSYKQISSDQKVTFNGLEKSKAYEVFISGKAATLFALDELADESDNEFGLVVEKRSDTSVKVKWKGASKKKRIEIIDGKTVEKEEKTNEKVITFTGLQPDTKYKIYVDGEYVESFRIDSLKNTSNSSDIKNLEIKKLNEDMSVDIYWDWKATSNKENREVEVSLKSNGKITDRKKTKNREVTFLNLNQAKSILFLLKIKK